MLRRIITELHIFVNTCVPIEKSTGKTAAAARADIHFSSFIGQVRNVRLLRIDLGQDRIEHLRIPLPFHLPLLLQIFPHILLLS